MSVPPLEFTAVHWGERLLREAYEALCELPPPAALVGVADQLEAAALAALPVIPDRAGSASR